MDAGRFDIMGTGICAEIEGTFDTVGTRSVLKWMPASFLPWVQGSV